MHDIVIRGEHIVHGIYITVIVILAVALVFNSSGDGNSSANDNSEDDVQILKDASVTIIKNTNLKPPSTVTIPNTPSSSSNNSSSSNGSNNNQTTTINDTQPTTPPPASDSLLPITGQIGLSIDKITKEIKGDDWAKVVKIKFTITNQKPKSFYPKILAYLWDDDDPGNVKTYVDEEIYLDKLETGKSITEEKDVLISFNEIDKEKTLKLVLYDEDDEIMGTVIEKFTVS